MTDCVKEIVSLDIEKTAAAIACLNLIDNWTKLKKSRIYDIACDILEATSIDYSPIRSITSRTLDPPLSDFV